MPESVSNQPVIKIASREVIRDKMLAAGLPLDSDLGDVYSHFVDSIADSEKVASGVVLAWAFALHDKAQDFPEPFKVVLSLSFDSVVDCITENKVDAQMIKDYRDETLKGVREEASKSRLETEEKVAQSLQDYDLFVMAHRVADIFFEGINEFNKGKSKYDRVRYDDFRKQGANPFYNQTRRGLFLSFSYGVPHSLWTPWGEYSFRGSGGGGNDDELNSYLMSKVETILYKPEENNRMGSFGPVYILTKVEGVELPDAREREAIAYAEYDEVDQAWKELDKKYKASKKNPAK